MQQVEKLPEVPFSKTDLSKKPSKKNKGKEIVQEKSEIEILQEQLREARQEVIKTKLEFDAYQNEVLKKIYFYDEIADKSKKMIKRNLPLQRMLQHMYRRNSWLQADRKRQKEQLTKLETQIEMIQIELKKKNLKIVAEIDGTP